MLTQTLFVWLHLLSAALLLAYSLVSIFTVTIGLKSDDPRIVAFVFRLAHFADWSFGFPAYLLIAASGTALVNMQGYAYDESWLVVSFALFLLTGASWLPPLYRQWRQTEAIDKALHDGDEPADNLMHKRQGSIFFVWLPLLLMVISYWIMIARPEFWPES